MTNLTPALSAAQKALLRLSRWEGAQYLSLSPNENCYTARVSANPTGDSYATLSYNNGVGVLGDVEVGMTVLISHTNNKQAAFFRGRIRATPGVATLYINETSAPVVINDYIFVLWDFDIMEKLPRQVGTTRYNDWSIGYSASNNGLPPTITNIQAAYAGEIDTITNKLRLRFQPSAQATTSGAAINAATWQFTVVYGAAAVIAGALNSADVTLDFTEGFNMMKLVVQDTGGRQATRFFPVHAHGDTYTPALGFTGASITRDTSGQRATTEAFDGISSVLDRTQVVIWYDDKYGNTDGPIVTQENVAFVGRLRTESAGVQTDETYSSMHSTQFEIEGPSQLQFTASQLISMLNVSSPATWDEINDLTPWRAVWYMLNQFSTFGLVHSLEFDDISNDYEVKILTSQTTDLWSMTQDLAGSIMYTLEFDPQGRGFLNPDARYLSTLDRLALTTVMALENQDFTDDLSIRRDYIERVGQITGFGGSYNSTVDFTTVVASLAPGTASGPGIEKPQYNGQVLEANQSEADAQTELNERVANHFEQQQPKDQLSATLVDGFHFLTPSVSQWFTWTLSATDTGKIVYATNERWLLTSVSVEHDNEVGTSDVSAVFIRETSGTASVTFDIPPQSDYQFSQFDFPAFSPFGWAPELPSLLYGNLPALADFHPFPYDLAEPVIIPPRDGNTVVAGGWQTGAVTTSGLYLTDTFMYPAPLWKDITPTTSVQVKDFGFIDPFGTDLGAYCLTYDGSADSKLWKTDNFYADPIEWTNTYTFVGEEWEYMRVIDGGVYVIRATATVGFDVTYDFTANDGGWTAGATPGNPAVAAVYVPATGWQSQYITNTGGPDPPVPGQERLFIDSPDISPCILNSVSIDYNIVAAGGVGAYDLSVTSGASFDSGALAVGAHTINWAGSVYISDATDGITIQNFISQTAADVMTITSVNITGTAYIASGSQSRYSNDGTAFTAIESAGTSPGYVGSDGIKAALTANTNPFLIGTFVQVKTTGGNVAGGAYVDEPHSPASPINPVSIVVPYFEIGSATAKNTGTVVPHYIVASNFADGSGDSHFRVLNDTPVPITPDTNALGVGPQTITMSWADGNHIAAIVAIGATLNLYVSDDAGDTWTDCGELSIPTAQIRMRKGDGAAQQLFIAGSDGLTYSPDFGTTLEARIYPGAGTARFIEVFG